MKIAMIGTGYVGLVSGVCFSDFGHEVICVDKDPAKIAALTAGRVPIFEPGLEALMNKNVTAGRLSFTLDLAAAVAEADVIASHAPNMAHQAFNRNPVSGGERRGGFGPACPIGLTGWKRTHKQPHGL